MIDEKETLIKEICGIVGESVGGRELQEIRNKITILLNPYNITTNCTDISTEVRGDDMKAYQMFFISKKIEGLSQKTLTQYKYIVDEFLSFINKSFATITTNDVRYFLAVTQKERGCSNSYNDTRRRYLNSFFSWLEAEGYIGRNPVKAIKKIKYEKVVRMPFEPSEMEKLRDALKVYTDSSGFNDKNKELLFKRNLAILEVLLSTGMRVGELAKLEFKNLNLTEGTVKVLGKGSKERICYLNDVAKLRLSDYLNCRKYESTWVFTNIANKGNKKKEDTPCSISSVEVFVREIGKIAGLTDVHPHRFRRTAATWCIRRGMDIEKVRQMLGHASIETTLIYAITSDDDVKTSHRKYMN